MEKSSLRPVFATEMAQLEKDVLDMVSRAENMVALAVDSLVNQSPELAETTLRADDEIDIKEIEIEKRCIRLLALQQPIGSDLREVGAVLKLITDIERIGDLAVDLAKLTLKIEMEMGRSDYIDIKQMSNSALQMLREAVQMFIRRDAAGVAKVAQLEEEVDKQYRDLRGQVHDYMRNNPDQVVAASWLLLAVHHVERIADHALNIAERVVYMVTGEMTQLTDDLDSGKTPGA